MFQFAFESVLFEFKHERPAFEPLPRLPKARNKEPDGHASPLDVHRPMASKGARAPSQCFALIHPRRPVQESRDPRLQPAPESAPFEPKHERPALGPTPRWPKARTSCSESVVDAEW